MFISTEEKRIIDLEAMARKQEHTLLERHMERMEKRLSYLESVCATQSKIINDKLNVLAGHFDLIIRDKPAEPAGYKIYDCVAAHAALQETYQNEN